MSSSVDGRVTHGAPLRRTRFPRKVRRAVRALDLPATPVPTPVQWRRPSPPDTPAAQPLAPLIAAYTALYSTSWRPPTRTKHAADFRRLLDWLAETGRPATTDALDFPSLVAYVEFLRSRPKVTWQWRTCPGVAERGVRGRGGATLSLNSVNAYMRPIRSLCLWLVEEGILAVNPFHRSHGRAACNPLLPSEETPPKSATLEALRALERGCEGEAPLDLRDQAILSILTTTAARNSSVRLLRVEDVDLERSIIRFRRAKGGKTLEVALHPETRDAMTRYLQQGRPTLLAGATDDPGYLFLSAHRDRGPRPLLVNAVSLMLRRRYHAGGGTLPTFGSHRIRHATATILVNNGMPLEEVNNRVCPTRQPAACLAAVRPVALVSVLGYGDPAVATRHPATLRRRKTARSARIAEAATEWPARRPRALGMRLKASRAACDGRAGRDFVEADPTLRGGKVTPELALPDPNPPADRGFARTGRR